MIPLVRNIRRRLSFKELAIVFAAVLLSVAAGVGVFHLMKKDVTISDDGRMMYVKTMAATVGDVLKQNGINLTKDDYISKPMGTKLKTLSENTVEIRRAIPVIIKADNTDYRVMTYKDTVAEALAQSPVKLGELDRLVGVEKTDRVTRNMTIKVVRVREELVAEKTSIPYKVTTRESRYLDKGAERVIKEGKEGTREKQFKVTIEDGKEIARKLIKNFISSAPITKIVEVGTVLNYKTARGDVIRYSKVLNMKATAYTASYKDTGKHPGDSGFGITATGMRVRKGIIAVDPRVIPLGTRVYIEVAGNTPDYGYAIAADVGGAIKGNLIDLYLDGQSNVDRWGRKRVKVYILND